MSDERRDVWAPSLRAKQNPFSSSRNFARGFSDTGCMTAPRVDIRLVDFRARMGRLHQMGESVEVPEDSAEEPTGTAEAPDVLEEIGQADSTDSP